MPESKRHRVSTYVGEKDYWAISEAAAQLDATVSDVLYDALVDYLPKLLTRVETRKKLLVVRQSP